MTALIGYGSHGKDIEAIWGHCHGDIKLDIFDEIRGPKPPAIARQVLIGVNDPSQRREIAERFPDPAESLVDPLAVIGIGIRVGWGSVIAPLACLLRDVQLGRHVHINYGASMTRCKVGDFVTIAPGAVICGDVVIGERSFIGASATICDRVKIGARCRIGAGAIIPPLSNVPDGTTVVGVWK